MRRPNALASLPLAAADLPAIGLPAWVIYYLALAILVTALQPRLGITGALPPARPSLLRRCWGPAALALAAALVWSAVLALPDGRLHLWFLDVGEGDATLIRTPRGQVILVDGGPSPVAISNALGRVLPFWQRHLDLVVLTHANEDHLLGLVEVARRYRIEQTIEPAVPSASGSFVEWEKALAAAETARAAALPGQSVDLGEGAALQILWPRGAAAGSQPENRGSVVMRLVYGQVSILLPGDIDAATGNQIVALGADLSGTILKVPHHGARSALDAALLRTIAPQAAVISAGAGNTFGHPAPETLALLSGLPVYRTDLQGTIELVTDGVTWQLLPER